MFLVPRPHWCTPIINTVTVKDGKLSTWPVFTSFISKQLSRSMQVSICYAKCAQTPQQTEALEVSSLSTRQSLSGSKGWVPWGQPGRFLWW